MTFSRRCFLASAAAASVPAWGADVPRPAPDFSVLMLDGSKLPLKTFRGKILVMTFINTT
jgi:hypothetical protein